jgi:hypothetical protein
MAWGVVFYPASNNRLGHVLVFAVMVSFVFSLPTRPKDFICRLRLLSHVSLLQPLWSKTQGVRDYSSLFKICLHTVTAVSIKSPFSAALSGHGACEIGAR